MNGRNRTVRDGIERNMIWQYRSKLKTERYGTGAETGKTKSHPAKETSLPTRPKYEE